MEWKEQGMEGRKEGRLKRHVCSVGQKKEKKKKVRYEIERLGQTNRTSWCGWGIPALIDIKI